MEERLMLDLNVSLDARELTKFRRLLTASRTEAAKALTFTAQKAQVAWRTENMMFHRRNTWLDKGVRIRPATPGNLTAQVGTIDKFFSRHVRGMADPKKGRLLVPIYDDIAEVPTHRRLRAMLRRMSGTQRKPFILKSGSESFLARRFGKARGDLKLLAKIQNGARIEPRFDAQGVVERTVRREFTTVYERLLVSWSSRQG
jgi:hypothetical protein